MANASVDSTTVPNRPSLKPDDVFWLLAEPARRGVLLALRNGATLATTQLTHASGLRASATEKHLTQLLKAGLLVAAPDRTDKRRTLYGLSPAVSVIKTETGTAMDFGCCLMVCDGQLQLSGIAPVRPIVGKD